LDSSKQEKKSGKYFSPVNSFAINSHELYFFFLMFNWTSFLGLH
jgi:hypothetical protein